VRALLRALPDIVRTIGGLALDPVLPKAAKIALGAAVLYLVSPIDLIPDFIPVVGYLDDVILVPLGVLLVIKLIPPGIMAEHRALAAAAQDQPVSRGAAIAVVVIWLACAALAGWLCYHLLVN
jgi:Protein of unknown function (DUF1232)